MYGVPGSLEEVSWGATSGFWKLLVRTNSVISFQNSRVQESELQDKSLKSAKFICLPLVVYGHGKQVELVWTPLKEKWTWGITLRICESCSVSFSSIFRKLFIKIVKSRFRENLEKPLSTVFRDLQDDKNFFSENPTHFWAFINVYHHAKINQSL